jgi:hypothetical protein
VFVVNETTDLLGGEAFLTWFAVGTFAFVLGILAVSYASRGKAALELGPEALRAGKLLVPWRCVTRVELATTSTNLDVKGGPVLEWLLFDVEDGTELAPSMSQRRIVDLIGEDWADVGVSAADMPVAPQDLLAEVQRRVAVARGA